MFLLKISGNGIAFLSSYGAVYEIKPQAGQKYTVGTGYIASFEEGIEYKAKTVDGIKSTLCGGEGLCANLPVLKR